MKRVSVIANSCIAFVLVGLAVVVFSADLSGVFLTVSAPMRNGHRDRNAVAMMVVVDGGGAQIESLMNTLAERGAAATFFVNDAFALRNMNMVRQIAVHNEIGNAGANIGDTHTILYGILGARTTLFTPPNGSYTRGTLRTAESMGYTTIMWSRTIEQWQAVMAGDIIKISPSEVAILPQILDDFLTRGLSVQSVSAVIG
ncbi:MAG: hypothetical protein FWE38_03760 [Firmicutes bacterium]|nr:hypothetical protein [Bacillota bacterium]